MPSREYLPDGMHHFWCRYTAEFEKALSMKNRVILFGQLALLTGFLLPRAVAAENITPGILPIRCDESGRLRPE